MSLTTALFTGLTGMDVHGKSLDVIGDNITNVNTAGFKSSRAVFETQLSSNLSLGTAPSAESGGTNPTQIGLGTKFGGTQRNMGNGAIQSTGKNTDLALEGAGFFILEQNGKSSYTRNGSFDLDSERRLVAPNGARVQGYGVDQNFNITQGGLDDIQIPVGSLTLAEATRNVELAGNLNASGATASNGARIASGAMTDLNNPGPADESTLLTDLSRNGADPLFQTGDVVTINGAEKGGKLLGNHAFEVGPDNTTDADGFGTTLGDFTSFLNNFLGLSGNSNNGGETSGVSVNGDGEMVITGDHGKDNHIKLETSDIASNGITSQPFLLNTQQDADGESVRTSFEAYDSLGTPIAVDLTLVLEDKDSSGTGWRYYAESSDNQDGGRFLDTGTLRFDSFGEIEDDTPPVIGISREGTGAADPMQVTLDFMTQGNFTALTSQGSEANAVHQDGTPVGTLESFSVQENGVITGAFTNGLSRDLGQVAVATFTNPEGLVAKGGNAFEAGAASGLPVNVAPLSAGAGRIVSGALEQSNVDLSKEFVDLISTSTGFSASSRVISTSDQLIQQLLAMGR